MAEAPDCERSLREAVVRTAHAMFERELVAASMGNVSVIDRKNDTIYITPSGLPYTRMDAHDVVAIDTAGRPLDQNVRHRPSSEWRLHASIYRSRKDVHAAVHVHGIAAQAWSFLGEALPARTEEQALIVGGDVQTAPFAPSGSQLLADGAVSALEGRQGALLAHHGVIGIGRELERALHVCEVIESQARVAWLLRHTQREH